MAAFDARACNTPDALAGASMRWPGHSIPWQLLIKN
jgi:hypothetical protein